MRVAPCSWPCPLLPRRTLVRLLDQARGAGNVGELLARMDALERGDLALLHAERALRHRLDLLRLEHQHAALVGQYRIARRHGLAADRDRHVEGALEAE